MEASNRFCEADSPRLPRSRSPHLSLAKTYWQSHLNPEDFAIDMTCGNGHDTQYLASLVTNGWVFSVDIQKEALVKAQELLGCDPRIRFIHQSHSEPLPFPLPGSPNLIVYNLGYLPGGDKSITTKAENTLRSLELACDLLLNRGALSITCYPGHEEGNKEEELVIAWAKKLDPKLWRICLHQWINRKFAPSLLWIIKLNEPSAISALSTL